jgi:hypothetical protein
MTNLAASLSPPRKPASLQGWQQAIGLGAVIGVIISWCAWSYTDSVAPVKRTITEWIDSGWVTHEIQEGGFHGISPLLAIIVTELMGILVAASIAAYWKILKPAYEKDLRAWDRRMQTWDQLFYCNQCDTVFNPQTNQASPVDGWQRLLS